MKRRNMPIAIPMHRELSRRDHRRAARRRGSVVAGIALVVLGLVGAPAAAQTRPDVADPPKTKAQHDASVKALEETLALAPDASPPQADDPFQEVVDANVVAGRRALARLDITARSNDANVKALAAAEQLKAAKLKETAALQVRKAAVSELASERSRLSKLTVRAYVTGGDVDVEQYRAYVEGDTTDPSAGRQIMFNQVLARQKQVTEQAHRDLDVARAKLADVRKVVAVAEDKAIRLLGIASDLTRRRAAAEQAHLQAVAAADLANVRLRTAANHPIVPVSVDVPLIGLPRLNAEDLAGWFLQSPYRPRVSTPIQDYALWFIQEGRSEGIRGDVAFAQAVLETGGFANTDSVLGNNFSGIGHYDNLPLGWTFPSPRMGVRAQIQLLKSYAVKKPNYANTLVDKRLHGPAGCCETWGDLTTVWATDPTYGPKVMLIYTAIVDYALKRRARGEGFDDPSNDIIAKAAAATTD